MRTRHGYRHARKMQPRCEVSPREDRENGVFRQRELRRFEILLVRALIELLRVGTRVPFESRLLAPGYEQAYRLSLRNEITPAMLQHRDQVGWPSIELTLMKARIPIFDFKVQVEEGLSRISIALT